MQAPSRGCLIALFTVVLVVGGADVVEGGAPPSPADAGAGGADVASAEAGEQGARGGAEESPEAVFVDLMGEVAARLGAAQAGDAGGCAASAAALDGWLDERLATLTALAQPLRARAAGVPARTREALEAALAPHVEVLLDVAMRCADHGATRAAFARFGALRR